MWFAARSTPELYHLYMLCDVGWPMLRAMESQQAAGRNGATAGSNAMVSGQAAGFPRRPNQQYFCIIRWHQCNQTVIKCT